MRRLLALATAIGLSGCIIASFDIGALRGPSALEEITVHGKRGPKLVMVAIEGVLQDTQPRLRLGGREPTPVARVREALERAAKDDDVAALLLRIQSPGGTVSASETLYYEIQRWRRETGKPVVAYLRGIAASGGYYVAMAADELIAHPTTVTGSIGVLMRGINLTGLMERWGVKDQSLKSGAFKDAASPLRPMRADERAQLQSVIDDLHARFVEVVSSGRPELGPDAVRRLSDGRIYSAPQALEAGLIDGIGHLEEAIEAAQTRAGIEESRVVMYREGSDYVDNLYSRAPQQIVDIDLFSPDESLLAPGFYYLWPGLLE